MPIEKSRETDPGKVHLPSARNLRFIKVIVSICLTVLIGYIIYREVPDWRQSLNVMVQGKALMILAGLIGISFHMLLRAARWGMLLKPSKEGILYKNLFSLTLVKYVINVVPPRTGEIASSILLARKEDMSVATVIAASVFERILDMVTVVALFVAYVVFFGGRFVPKSETGREVILSVRSYSIKGFIVICVVLAVLALLLKITRWSTLIPLKIRKPALHFLDGFRALQSHGAMLKVILLSLAIWITITLQLWCLVCAYLPAFPFAGAVLIMALTVIGVSIPTPGGIGGFQYFMNLTLIHFFWQHLSPADPYSQAMGISNGCYVVSMAPVYIAGLIFMNREGISFGGISKLSERRQVLETDS